jgi:hypothetical protein
VTEQTQALSARVGVKRDPIAPDGLGRTSLDGLPCPLQLIECARLTEDSGPTPGVLLAENRGRNIHAQLAVDAGTIHVKATSDILGNAVKEICHGESAFVAEHDLVVAKEEFANDEGNWNKAKRSKDPRDNVPAQARKRKQDCGYGSA